MAKICYVPRRFNASSRPVIATANEILIEYAKQGFDLTLRQLYYQFVARGLISNNMKEYKKLGSIINDARLAGLIDWDHIVDRTRNLRGNSHWSSPQEILNVCADQFRIDKWADQPHHVEVWIEKDALIGVIEGICRRLDINHYSCRGYVSQSEVHEAAKDRLVPLERIHKKQCTILHFGDHDPSGVDMSRDIEDRLRIFGSRCTLKRMALNMDQVEQYNPPPNPAKLTDSRAEGYIALHGDDSWELDALEPSVIGKLIEDAVAELRDQDTWDESEQRESEMREQLTDCKDRWDEVRDLLSDKE